MWALEGNAESASPNPGLQSVPDGRAFQHANRGTHSHEDPATGRGRWSPLEMLHQRGRDFIGQRQFQRRRGLGLADSQTALSPAKVIEAEGYYFTGPQSVGGNQQKHRVVAQSFSRGLVNGSQEGADRLPREGSWQRFEPVKARRIDLAGQPLGNPAVQGEESKKSPQRTDVDLETCPAQAFAGLGDVGFDMTSLDFPQGDSLFIQVLEKAWRGVAVVGNGSGGASAHFAQVVGVPFDQNRGGGSCGCRSAISNQTLHG